MNEAEEKLMSSIDAVVLVLRSAYARYPNVRDSPECE